MKQERCEREHRELWTGCEETGGVLSRARGLSRLAPDERERLCADFDARYRQICQHLALSRARRYSLELQHRLNQLALEGHRHLYAARSPILKDIAYFLVAGFAQAFRRRWRFMADSGLLFFGTGSGFALAFAANPDLVYSMVSPEDVIQYEEMYATDRDVLGRERESESDFAMFGYYIYNNVSIGFRTYAGGLVFGLGTLFYVLFNGLYIGAVAGHLTISGLGEPFWSFVSGHSALELTAIVIFGGVGLTLGASAISPGKKRRWRALRDTARDTLPLVYGGTVMLFMAAFVEAYWSSTTWPPPAFKYGVGIAFWCLHAAYFVLAGRRR